MDTIERTVVKKFKDGSELVEQQVITFTGNDLSVAMDSLYYNAEGSYPEMGQGYRIHFDRKEVIAFCDSMLQALGPENLENFNDASTYRSILNHARTGKADAIVYDETHCLLNRFRPLIVHQQTGHKPPYYFSIHSKSSRREDFTRHFVSQKGDTLQMSWEVIWVASLPEIEE
ncbi:MAG TPA: hypothetical protein VGB71_13945 [Flavisolibacter sp.]